MGAPPQRWSPPTRRGSSQPPAKTPHRHPCTRRARPVGWGSGSRPDERAPPAGADNNHGMAAATTNADGATTNVADLLIWSPLPEACRARSLVLRTRLARARLCSHTVITRRRDEGQGKGSAPDRTRILRRAPRSG